MHAGGPLGEQAADSGPTVSRDEAWGPLCTLRSLYITLDSLPLRTTWSCSVGTAFRKGKSEPRRYLQCPVSLKSTVPDSTRCLLKQI